MQKFNSFHFAVIAIVAVSFTSCSTYYKANSISSVTPARDIDSLNKINRYFILRNGEESFAIKKLSLSTDQKTAQCKLDSLPLYHQLHLTNGKYGRKVYNAKRTFQKEVIKEVHYYIPKDSTAAFGDYTLQLEKLTKIEVLEHDKKRTNRSRVLGGVLITGGVVVAAALVYGIALYAALSSL
jgi:hypothetical protein